MSANGGVWVTVKGTHIFIKDDETFDEAVTRLKNYEDKKSKDYTSLKSIDKYDVENPIKMASPEVIKGVSDYYNKHRNDGEWIEKEINPKDLETRQDWLDKGKMEDFSKGFDKSKYKGDSIRAVEYKGHTVLVDGNHRVATALLQKKKTVKVEVLK